MTESPEQGAESPRELKFISTHWTAVANPSRFVTRYGAAVRAYLRALLPSQDDADEVEQEFLLQVVAKGFPTVAPGRGHFRHYLIAIVRNAAYGYLRKRSRQPVMTGDLSRVPSSASAERQWQDTWRQCVLQNALNALRDHQKRNKGNLFHTVLKTYLDYPDESSAACAERVSRATGRTLTAEAFRKQLSRARERFAQLLIEEVSRTITAPTPALLAEELRELDLMAYVAPWAPDDLADA